MEPIISIRNTVKEKNMMDEITVLRTTSLAASHEFFGSDPP